MAVKKADKNRGGAPEGNKNAVGNEGGRPSLYKPEYAEQAYKLCLLGANDEELGVFFEVTEQTINNWKKDHVEFFESVTRGKVIADAEVAQSFHKRAVGYRYTEVTFEKIDATDEEDIVEEVYKKKVVVKELPPDAGAALNWLKNRQKDKWRDKQELGVTDSEGKDRAVTVFQIPDNGRDSNG